VSDSGDEIDNGRESGLLLFGEKILKRDDTRVLQLFKMAEMGIMASSILHEIRQPLFSIKGYVQMMLLDAQGAGDIYDRLLKVHELVEDLERRANTFLDFSRNPHQYMVPLRIIEPVEGALKLFQNRIKKAGVQLHLDISDDLPLVKGNPTLLQQVFVNLLGNSLHSLERVDDFEARHIWVRSFRRSTDDRIELLLADTGAGIAPELQDKVFDLFFTTKPNGEGTGIGLAVSREIIEAHNGALRLVNDQDCCRDWIPSPSVVFSLTLPRVQKDL
jgi:signal transduction histidine kinase